MYRYLLRRLAQAIPTLFAVIVIVFLLFNLVPGNVIGGGDADQVLDPQGAERIRAELMLDRPLHERFYHYMSNLVRGDLGHHDHAHVVALGVGRSGRERGDRYAARQVAHP